MKVSENKVVSLSYTLTVNGREIEKVEAAEPLTFIFGSGMLLPKFEENVLGKEVGDSFDFELEAADAYGEMNPQMVVDLPLKMFEMDGKIDYEIIKEGNILPMQDRQGHRMNGIIKAVKALEEKVTMDFNHPLAGEKLHFTGKVESVREATEKELQDGLYGEKIQHSCSDEDCSSCGGGCSHCH
ncbi:MAG: peptidylprolyl isomerase [Bacteroidales bacterium]|nr:peptidylprolyl isomerase [Bacteroidales bacterium]MBP5518612.1 peptidylprolyl isomerase [Bacteroidales bacterium]